MDSVSNTAIPLLAVGAIACIVAILALLFYLSGFTQKAPAVYPTPYIGEIKEAPNATHTDFYTPAP